MAKIENPRETTHPAAPLARCSIHRSLAAFACALASLVALARPVAADTQSSLGFGTGEGSTQFTGLAQSPEANLFTGAMSTSIPIEVPPGRKNMTPKLALVYSSTGGPSPYGYGWDLPLGKIERTTKWGVPYCGAPHFDEFVLSMPGLAVELVREPATGIYRPRVEDAYFEASKTSDVWTAYDRSGIQYVFGAVPQARFGPTSPCAFTSVWYLTHVEDTNGNTIDITYVTTDGVPYPQRVAWGGRAGSVPNFYFVDLDWAARPAKDLPVSFNHGAKMQLTQRLAAVRVLTLADPTFRTYSLDYDGQDTAGAGSLLNAVRLTAYPSQLFLYSDGTQGLMTVDYQPPPGISKLRVIDASLEVTQTVLDMDGDGRLDLVRSEADQTWSVYLGCSPGENNPAGCDGPYGFSRTPVNWGIALTPPTGGSGTFSVDKLRDVIVDCPGAPQRCAQYDTFDITGDGVADFVWAAASPWKVYAGQRVGGTLRFNPTPLTWPSQGVSYIHTDAGEYTTQDVRDMNGDGLTDLVRAEGTTWSVYLNTGSGFAAARSFDSPFAGIELAGTGLEAHALFDFNGDGLPDMVMRNRVFGVPYVQVYFNSGSRFEPQGKVVPIGGEWFPAHGAATMSDFVDVNGDGLPDYVSTCPATGGSVARVALNTGGDLEEPVQIGGLYVPPRQWPSLPYCQALRDVGGTQSFDMVDVDGDGRIDRVEGNLGSQPWRLRLNTNASHTTPRAKLLTTMQSGLGGITDVRYRPSSDFENDPDSDGLSNLPFVTWVTTAVRRTDGMCNTPGGVDAFDRAQNPCINQGHELIARHTYGDGMFDAASREFRGFAMVVSWDIDDNPTLSQFLQDATRKGRLAAKETYAGSGFNVLVRRELNTWTSAAFPGTQAGRSQLWLAGSTIETRDDGSGPVHTVSRTNDRPDAYGNIPRSIRSGSSVDPLTTSVDYAITFGSRVFDKPSHILKRNGAGTTLEEQWFYYDNFTGTGFVGKGNVTRTESWLDTRGTNARIQTTRISYDALGNTTGVTDARQFTTSTDYETTTALFPQFVRNPLGHTTETTFDYKWGKPTQQVDANGAVTQLRYDAAGRPERVIRPGESSFSERYEYQFKTLSHPGSIGPVSGVITYKREPNAPGGAIATWMYFDALGRPRGTATQRQVGAASSLTTVVVDDVDYDAAGRVVRRYDTYDTSHGARNNGSTQYDYLLNGGSRLDPLGRVHRATQPNGQSTRMLYRGQLREQFDELGTKTVLTIDAEGRTVRQELFNGASVYSSLAYTYDALGRLTSTTQNGNASTTVTATWDSLGRRTSVFDPDSGTWRYQYDDTGNLTFQDFPKRSQSVQLCYDAIGRVTAKYYLTSDSGPVQTCGLGKAEERYTYDEQTFLSKTGVALVNEGVGRLTKVEDKIAKTTFRYDLRGRAIDTVKSIGVGAVHKTAGISFDYDLADHVIRTTYPDDFVVTTSYNQSGQPRAHGGFVTSIQYDPFGRMTRLQHGNGTTDTYDYYDQQGQGTSNNHRLREIDVLAPGGGNHLALRYNAYTPRGQLQEIDDLRNPGGPVSNGSLFTYDFAGRLTQFVRGSDGATLAYGYDALGNVTSKEGRTFTYGDPTRPHRMTQINGPTPLAVTHDDNGSRTKKATTKYTYDKLGRLWKVKLPGHRSIFYYDYSGRRVMKRDTTAHSRTVATRYFGDLFELTGKRQTRRYFVAGMYVASEEMAVPSGVTYADARSLSDFVQVAGDVSGANPVLRMTLSGGADTALLAIMLLLMAALVVRTPRRGRLGAVSVRVGPSVTLIAALVLGTLPWAVVLTPSAADAQTTPTLRHYHHDHLGSTQVITTVDGSIDLQVRYEPWGQVRGRFDAANQPKAVLTTDRYEFTGYETDVGSGLQYAGARFYDPDLGLFTTQDPARQFANPYTYTNFDPVNRTDPTGQAVEGLIAFVVAAFVVGFAAAAIQAGVNGASVGEALKAGAIAGGIAGVSALGLGLLSSAVEAVAPSVTPALDALRVAAGAYQAYEDANSGQWVSFGFGLQALAFGLNAGDDGDPASRGGAGVPGKSTRIGDIFGKLWNAPNTVIGVAWGAVGALIHGAVWLATMGSVDLGFGVQFDHNAIGFVNHPLQKLGEGSVTLGNSIAYGGLPTDPTRTTNPLVPRVPTWIHEIVHTLQGEILGPLYLPANLLGMAASVLSAPVLGRGPGDSLVHGPLNFMERGPLSVPQRLW